MKKTLEEMSLWYKYKTEVWPQKSKQSIVIHNIMRVLRAIRNSGDLAYVSVPITSGKFLNELKLEKPYRDDKKMLKVAMDHNYNEGWDFVRELRKRINCPVLYPADLIPADQRWMQVHFQALWLNIISEKCTELHMSDGWQYSNGGSEEFTHTIQLRLGLPKGNLFFYNTKEDEGLERERMRNIKIYDHEGDSLSIDRGTELIKESSWWLDKKGLDAKALKNCLSLLNWTREMINQGFYQ